MCAGEVSAPVELPVELLSKELSRLHEEGVPGVVVGWQQGDQLPVYRTSGVVNVETQQEIHREHMVRAGSVLKMAVGTLVLMLADDELLCLDDVVGAYVEGVPGGDRITIRMLGNHTSGIFNALGDAEFRKRINDRPELVLSHEEVLKVSYDHGLVSKPGRKFSYSNSNTILLAEVVEKVTGQAWQEVLQRRVLRTLGAVHAKVPSLGWLPESQPELRGYRHGTAESSIGYGKVFLDATAFSPSWAGAGGDWVTNVGDLMALARPLAKGVLLSERMRAEQRSWVKTGNGAFRYGFCLAEWNRCILGHSGDVPGFSMFVGWHGLSDASVVVWSNLSNLKDKNNPAERLGLKLLMGK